MTMNFQGREAKEFITIISKSTIIIITIGYIYRLPSGHLALVHLLLPTDQKLCIV